MTTLTDTRSVVRRLVAAAGLTLLLGLPAACGDDTDDGSSALPDAGGSSTASTTDDEADIDPEDAMLKFAQCMRDHGVDVPDPKPGGGLTVNGKGLSESQMKAAESACQKWMDLAEPDDADHELSEEEKQSFLDMAACMRARGYNFPDPTFDGGRVTQKLEKGDGEQGSPDDPSFQKDMEECNDEAGIEPPDDAEGGSTDEHSSDEQSS